MNTKYLMITCSLFQGLMGIVLTFLPQEIANYMGIALNQLTILLLQILGSFYLGFALLNWMSKDNLIGGIYRKPLVVGNLIHFLVSSLTLIKILFNAETHFNFILLLSIPYVAFTFSFGYIMRSTPKVVHHSK